MAGFVPRPKRPFLAQGTGRRALIYKVSFRLLRADKGTRGQGEREKGRRGEKETQGLRDLEAKGHRDVRRNPERAEYNNRRGSVTKPTVYEKHPAIKP
jgi:hypothetical protein